MGCCKSKCGKAGSTLTDEQKSVLTALAGMDEPSTSKGIAEAAGLDSKTVSCKIQGLKKRGLVESPARCRYILTESGRAAL